MVEKSPEAYRTIGEASKEVGEPSYVLRFWETKFKQIKLIKRPGGRRFYRPEDISLLLKIKNFLRNDGLSIKDVNSKLNDSKASSLSPINNLDKQKSSIATELNISSSEKSNKGEVLKKLNEILETLS